MNNKFAGDQVEVAVLKKYFRDLLSYCGSVLQGTETLYSVGAPQGKDGF